MKPLVRRAVDVAERALKVRILRETSIAAWPEAEFIRSLFCRLQPDCVFDVGANIGQYASELRAVEGFTGTILSFEPNPNAYQKLVAAAAADPRWHCFPFALGREAGLQTLNVTRSDLFASLRPIGESAREHFPWQVEIADTPQIEIRTIRAEYASLKKCHGFQRPFLKMDTQGYDLEVIGGAGTALSDFCGLVSEVALTALYEDAPTIERSIAEFRRHGFTPVGIFNVHPGEALYDLIECNCYCARDSFVTPFIDS